MKLLCKIMYDGTRYAGYQCQHDLPSVQSTLTDAFSACFGCRCTVTGCSRTDAGVHALGFTVAVEPYGEHEDEWCRIPVGKVHRALAPYLPDDIAVIGEARIDGEFHPRYSVVGKTYLYRMYDSPAENPFEKNRAWHLCKKLTENDVARMNEAGQSLVGRHDFTSFMAAGSKIVDATRTVTVLSVRRDEDGVITLSVSADGFLYNMVRIITGTLVDVGFGTIPAEKTADILAKRDRTAAGRTAPAYGLYLQEVEYDRPIAWVID